MIGLKHALAVAGLIAIYIGVRMNNIDKAARVAWGEARSEGSEGMQAVINVMQNRVNDRRFPNSLAGVATQRKQFSAFNENDPNRAQLDAVDDSDHNFVEAIRLAAAAMLDDLTDITEGATHYHNKHILPPAWTVGAIVSAKIGSHIFYREVQ